MNMFNKLCFISLVFYLVVLYSSACVIKNDPIKKVEIIKFSSVETTINLKGKPIRLNEKINYPYGIQIFDSLLIIRDNENNNKMLHFINTKNFKYLGGACKEGMGPGEFIGLSVVDTWNINHGFWAFDITKSSITKIFPDSAINDSHYMPSPELKIKRPKIHGFLNVSDSTFIGTFFGYEPRLALFNFFGDTLYSFLHYPELPNTYNLSKKDLQYKVKSYIYKAKIYKNLKRHKLVLCFFNSAALQIVDYHNAKLLKTVIGPDDTFPPKYLYQGNRAVISRESKRGYICASVTDDYIYALYSGKKSKDPDSVLGNQIIQFDWDGNPIKKYLLDHRLFTFAFDEINSKFYGIDVYLDKPFIEFALP